MAATLVAGLTAATAAQADPQAEPAPAFAVEPAEPPAAPAGSVARIRLAESFLEDLERSGAVLVGTGQTEIGAGGTVRIPVVSVLGDGFGLGGGYAITVNGQTTFNCPQISVSLQSGGFYCGKDGVAKQVLDLGEPEKIAKDGRWTTRANIPLRITNDKRADQMNDGLERAPFEAQDIIGEMDLTTRALLRGWEGEVDDRTGCWIGNYATDTSIWRGWAIQAMVNRLPENVGMSQYAYDGAAKRGVVAGPKAPAVTVGQRTPYMEGITTGAAKKIVRGSTYSSDNFYDGSAFGCNTNAPFVVGQGALDDKDVKAWRYDGGLRNMTNNPAGAARPQWWGHGRQENYNGPTGNYSWTCRGLPANLTSTGEQRSGDTWWSTVSGGSGFFGDSSRDKVNPDAGRAPACRDLNLKDFKLTTRYSISKRGGLEARNDQVEYPRYCSVDGNPLVSCWQEIYPLWDRAWAFQNHVYASAMRANITSNATIAIDPAWSPTGAVMVKPIAWRITDGSISGAWPKYVTKDDQGKDVTVDMSAIEVGYDDRAQDWSKPSPFTVPGDNTRFSVSGYGTPMGQQEMTFILTADTDGSWTWPKDKNGKELTRPQIKLTFSYLISNFDNGGSCKGKLWYDDEKYAEGGGRNNDAAGGHCLQGNVPTLWPLPKDDLWQRVPDAYITDKDGKRVPNRPNVTFEFTPLASCLNAAELSVLDFSTKTNVPNVGADFTWDIRLSGKVTKFSGC